MALPRKTSPAQTVLLTGQIPTPPKVPGEMLQRFPAWQEYQKGIDDWWGKFCEQLQRDRSQIQGQFTTDETAAQSLQSSLATLTQQLQTLSAHVGAPVDTSAILAQLSALSAQLSAHIAAATAHGTVTDIVGEEDQQSLESKTIGGSVPGYGRFTSLVLANAIPVGQTVVIGPNDTMLVAGPFTIDGVLKVEGMLVAL